MKEENKAEAKMLFKKLFLVRKCIKCREPLDVTDFDSAFCPKCREEYLSAKMAICPDCSLEASECKCRPRLLEKDDILALRRLFFYSKERASEPQNKLIYFIKANRSRRVSGFVAREIYPLIRSELSKAEDCVDRVPLVVTIPRSHSSLMRYGFDQSELIARELSKIYGFEHCDALKRRSGSSQKRLTAGERRKNIKALVSVNTKKADVIRGRTVILLDDVVTTGASMSACAGLLYDKGAKNILCIAIASDIKS